MRNGSENLREGRSWKKRAIDRRESEFGVGGVGVPVRRNARAGMEQRVCLESERLGRVIGDGLCGLLGMRRNNGGADCDS
jgi:hypothetical protein